MWVEFILYFCLHLYGGEIKLYIKITETSVICPPSTRWTRTLLALAFCNLTWMWTYNTYKDLIKCTIIKRPAWIWDLHLFACNFAKYLWILKHFFADRLSNKPFWMWLLTYTPNLKHVATLPTGVGKVCKVVRHRWRSEVRGGDPMDEVRGTNHKDEAILSMQSVEQHIFQNSNKFLDHRKLHKTIQSVYRVGK